MIKSEANEKLLKSGLKLVGAIDQGTSSTRFLVFTGKMKNIIIHESSISCLVTFSNRALSPLVTLDVFQKKEKSLHRLRYAPKNKVDFFETDIPVTKPCF